MAVVEARIPPDDDPVARRWRAAPVVAAAVVALASADPVALLVPFAVAALASAWFGWRIQADRLGQLALVLVVTSLVGILVPRFYPDGGPPTPWRWGPLAFFFGASSLVLATARLWLSNPRGGDRVTAGLLLITVMAAGAVSSRHVPLYPLLAAGWLLVQVPALAALDPAWKGLGGLKTVGTGVILGIAAAVTLGLSLLIPALHARAVDWLRAHRSSVTEVRFGEGAELGALHGLLQSDRVVMRIFGESPEYLRGATYSTYRSGQWSYRSGDRTRVETRCSDRDDQTFAEILSGDFDRYFLPLDAAVVGTSACVAQRTPGGVLVRFGERPAESMSWTPAPRDQFEPEPPDLSDREVPTSVRKPLERLAREWGGQGTPAQIVDRIAHRLRTEYAYSLEFDVQPEVDPLLDFLLNRKTGHCEYFASALTLLTRAVGVPSRMIAGYRVSEHNPITGWHIVRERNAHSWTEVWIDDAWHTVDATAASSLPVPRRTPAGAAVLDAIAGWLRAAWSAVQRLDPTALSGVAAALLVVWLVIRARRRRRVTEQGPGLRYRDPVPAFEALVEALARSGAGRAPSETIEALARRIAPMDPESAALIERYAARRYGGGDPAALATDLTARARAIGRG